VSKSVGSLASSATPSTAPTTTGSGSGSSSGQPTSTSHATLVHSLFEGILTSETRCLTCETVSHHNSLTLTFTPAVVLRIRILTDAAMIRLFTNRYPPGTSPSWISQSTLSKTRPSPRASDNSARVRCSASGTNFSATRVAGSRKLKSA
jgi:hypothetical protein